VKYRWRTKPYHHQIRAVKFAMRQFKAGRGVAFLMEPRTGKTKATIDTLCILHKLHGLRKVVIIAPNRVLDTWVDEIHTHSPLNIQTVVWDKDARKYPLPPASRAYDMQAVIVNYEAFGTPGRRTKSGARSRATGRFKHRTLLRKWLGPDEAACVVDEGHKIKAPQGKAATMIVSMRPLFKWRFLLTGTPVTKAKRAHDIFMQWQWVNPTRFEDWGATVEDFKNHTGRWISSNGFPQWTGPRTEGMDDLRTGIHRDGIVVRRDECLDLPPRMPDRLIRIPLGPSLPHYNEMAEEMVTRLESGAIAEASIPLVVTLRLQQITSGFVGIQERRVINGKPKLVSVPHRLGFEKLDALEELLTEETLEREEKVVIAARFKPDLTVIEDLCTHLKLKRWSIRGGMTREDTTNSIREFKKWDDAGAIVIQPAAASLGIDLSTAAHMIWYSLTPSWVDFTQASDRIALSPRSTTHTFLIAGPVDELLYEGLQQDTDVSRYILTHPRRLLTSETKSA
jgi:SNF2 family DNA or RNA helicase